MLNNALCSAVTVSQLPILSGVINEHDQFVWFQAESNCAELKLVTAK